MRGEQEESGRANVVPTAAKTPRVRTRAYLLYVLVYVLAAVGLLVLAITFTPLTNWWARWLAGDWSDPKGEVLLVLSAGGSEQVLSYESYLRAEYAVLTYRDHPFKKVIVSGAADQPVPESFYLRDFIVFSGIPAADVITEARSESTRENALFSRSLLDQFSGDKVLLTSDFHMFRAVRTFRKLGMKVLPQPFPDALKRGSTWRGRWPVFLDLCLETVKIGYYWARGWI